MKRFGFGLAAVYLGCVIAGCGGGIKEGMSNEPPTPSGQPAGFREMMEKNSKNMTLKGARPKNVPSGKSVPAGKPEP